MMLRTLRNKVIRLGRDEEGAALVVTLAVFMFMWLVCIGVFAVGTAVKTRTHLQNACDAAAYSAAVVQADTLSRIATINRAMSWAYVQMTRRQMDYIVYKWLEKTSQKYAADESMTKSLHLAHSSLAICPWRRLVPNVGWYIGSGRQLRFVDLNGSHNVSIDRVRNALGDFSLNWIRRQEASFYDENKGMLNISGLRNQIVDDKTAIARMNSAEDELLRKLPERVNGIVDEVIYANIKEFPAAVNERHKVWCRNDFTRILGPDAWEEDVFIGFVRNGDGLRRYRNAGLTFETGYNTWFPLGGGASSAEGFVRNYVQRPSCLKASWDWWWQGWQCYSDQYGHHCVRGKRGEGRSAVLGRDAADPQFYGQTACPRVLRKSYFGEKGTISVGISVDNTNPWADVLGYAGNVLGGIYSAFNPFITDTVVFASAKAGYKYLGKDPSSREYRIDWDEGNQEWNLCQSDWDAVLIPVRMAKSPATDGRWGAAGRFLYDWASELGVDVDLCFAGGTWTPSDERPKAFHEWNKLGAAPRHAEQVNARWQVENNAQTLDWDKLTDRMFH